MDLGFYISFSGIVTFKSAKDLQETCKQIPLDRMLIETDSPYLAPLPHRGKRNESSYITLVAQKLSEIYNLPIEEIARITTENSISVFGI